MARAWILVSCSWIGNGDGGLEQLERRELERRAGLDGGTAAGASGLRRPRHGAMAPAARGQAGGRRRRSRAGVGRRPAGRHGPAPGIGPRPTSPAGRDHEPVAGPQSPTACRPRLRPSRLGPRPTRSCTGQVKSDVVAERPGPTAPAATMIRSMPTGPKWLNRKVATRRPDVSAAAHRRAGPAGRARTCWISAGGHGQDQARSPSGRAGAVGHRAGGGSDQHVDGHQAQRAPARTTSPARSNSGVGRASPRPGRTGWRGGEWLGGSAPEPGASAGS